MVMCVFKEWAVTEFLVVEKEALFVVGLHELQVLRKGKWSSVTYDDALSGQHLVTQALLQCDDAMWSNH